MIIQEILDKYNAKRDTYYSQNEDPQVEAKLLAKQVFESYDGIGFPPLYYFDTPTYRYLKDHWKDQIGENYIGFSLALPCPEIFYLVIDEFLVQLYKENPLFIIKNISIKNGGVKFELDNINDKIIEYIELLEYELWDRRLLK